MARRRLDLTFPPNEALKPLTYHLVKDFDLTPNILRAQIQPGQQGRMLLEVWGDKDAIEQSGLPERLADAGYVSAGQVAQRTTAFGRVAYYCGTAPPAPARDAESG